MSTEHYTSISEERWNQDRYLYEARWDTGPGGRFDISSPFASIKLDPMQAARLRHALDQFIKAKLDSALDARVEAERVQFYIQQRTLSGWGDACFSNPDPNFDGPALFDSVDAAKDFIKQHVALENAMIHSKSTEPDLEEMVDASEFRVAIWEGD